MNEVINAKFTVIPFNRDEYVFHSFKVLNDAISKLYTIKIVIEASASFSEKNMNEFLGKTIKFEVQFSDDKKNTRFFSGVLTKVNLMALKHPLFPVQYELVLKPDFWLFKKSNGYRSWNELSSQDIMNSILQQHQKKNKDFKYQVIINKAEQLLKRRNTIQYGESDFDFLCRLMHEDGLNYFFIQNKDGNKLIISDDIENYFDTKLFQDIAPIETQIFSTPFKSGENTQEISFGYEHLVEIKTDSVLTYHCDPRNIKSDYGKSIKPGQSKLENNLNEWKFIPNLQKSLTPLEPSEAWAKKELTRLNSQSSLIKVESNLKGLFLGKKVTLVYYSNAKNNSGKNKISSELDFVKKIYRIASLKHKYKNHIPFPYQNDNYQLNEKHDKSTYNIELKLIPENEKYIKNFKIKKSNIPNVTTAFVYGEADKDTTVTDPMMIPISFFWQPKKLDSDTKCTPFVWARLSQLWASNSYGAFFIPAPGDEVLVIFENDIDLPIIVSSLYNSYNKCPILLNDDNQENRKMRGFVAGKDQNLVLNSKDFTSSVTFNENALLVSIKENSKFNIEEKSLQVNIKEKSKLDLNDEGKMQINLSNSEVEITERLKIATKSTNITGSDSIQLNSLRIKK